MTDLNGGTCVSRAAISYLLLKELGFDVEARLGGLLFRAGPDPGLDCVTFCDETNHGRVRDGRLIGHAWLELAGEFVDFSCNEWRHLQMPKDGLRPVIWQRDPPTFIWANQNMFGDWREHGPPELGHVWFGPWAGESPDAVLDKVMADVSGPFKKTVVANIRHLKLVERVQALHAGDLQYADNCRHPKPGSDKPDIVGVLARISQGSEGRVHFCDFVSRIKHLRHMRRACPSEAQNRLSSFDCRSNGCSMLISDSDVEYGMRSRWRFEKFGLVA